MSGAVWYFTFKSLLNIEMFSIQVILHFIKYIGDCTVYFFHIVNAKMSRSNITILINPIRLHSYFTI